MITAALEFIHARRWLVEAIIFAGIAGAVWLGCHHLIQVGVQRERSAWQTKLKQAEADAAAKAIASQKAAYAAEHAHDQELTELRKFRADNPLHGGLCKPRGVRPAEASTTNPGNAEAGVPSGDIQPVSSPDFEPGGQPEADVRGMLDVLAFRCDGGNAVVREYQARSAR